MVRSAFCRAAAERLRRDNKIVSPPVDVYAIASSLLCLAWIGVRLFVRSRPPKSSATVRQLLDPPWPAFDRWIRGAVVVALVIRLLPERTLRPALPR